MWIIFGPETEKGSVLYFLQWPPPWKQQCIFNRFSPLWANVWILREESTILQLQKIIAKGALG